MSLSESTTTGNKLGFSTSSAVGGGDPGRDYNPTSTDLDQQPAGDTGNYGGGVGDRTQGSARLGERDVEEPSAGDQYGSSGGYAPAPGQGLQPASDDKGMRGASCSPHRYNPVANTENERCLLRVRLSLYQ
ncbi:hypothetical protein DFH11DRAFT_1547834 [Phellopilus nigrolimitatus]|nr:hypothetical protein DFH11DRAFT_1547834 [Phellopilus nigrolimitatus]